jgi:hypothetical protein
MGFRESNRGKGDDNLVEAVKKAPSFHIHVNEKAIQEYQEKNQTPHNKRGKTPVSKFEPVI